VGSSATDVRWKTAPLPGAQLTTRVTRGTLQRLQDRFAALGRVTVCICTIEGGLITKPSWGSKFSQLIGTSPLGRAKFAEAIRVCSRDPDAKVPSICHEGMTLYATPIVSGGDRLAVIIVGTRVPGPPDRETVCAAADQYQIDRETLLQSAQRIDPYSGGTPEAIRRFADALADTIATLYAQADRIQRQLADLQTVHDFTGLLSGPLDLQEILDRTVRRVAEVMHVKACAIRLLNVDTGELVVKAVHNLSEEYLRKGPVLLRENLIDAGAFAGNTVYIPDAPNDPRTRYPENARREGIVSGLCVPLAYRGQSVGVIRVYTDRRYVFSKAEESLLRSIGSQAAAAIITGRLREEQSEAERFQRQVAVAGQIQRRMLPHRLPRHPALEFGCVYDPTLQVGGDFYDFIDLPDGKLAVCVADVVGKGLPAALMMASVRSAVHAHADQGGSVEAVVAKVNRHMCRDSLVSEFTTLVYGVFSADARAFTYCNAGHTPPLLLRGNRFSELTTGGLVIGVQPEETFDQDVLTIRPGDILTIVTDGVTEAMNFEGSTYGRERLMASIRKRRALGAPQLARQILWDVRRFAGLAEQSDDITIVVAKVN
jgi:serine phosphatase RsbU (regulator of sigma subunit)/ligand-binding sensor protein